MLRRVHVRELCVGQLPLDPVETRHLRDVLRLGPGTQVEVFDDAGHVTTGTLIAVSPDAAVQIDAIADHAAYELTLTVAAAVPKGERADWMIEKLSEVGCARFIPLASERSVVLPEGKNKRQRWMRIATESAKQSRRRGVMRIDELMSVARVLGEASAKTFYLSTLPQAVPSMIALAAPLPQKMMLLIGPEGGWAEQELELFARKSMAGVRLTSTILRVETAAVAAAAIVMSAAVVPGATNSQSHP